MKAGFSKVQLNIKEKLQLSGFGDFRSSSNILDGIFSKAIFMEEKKCKVLFLTIDLLFIGKLLSERLKVQIKNLYKIPEDNILISATHTHSAPKTCEQFLDSHSISQNFFNEVIKKSLKVVELAIKNKNFVTAELYETQDFPAINRRLPVPLILKVLPSYFNKKCVNRPNRLTSTDKTCRAIKFIYKNESFFWIINAAAHPTNYNGNYISSDYPYYIEKNLIKYSKKNLCKGSMFLQGWAGNQNCDLIKNIKINLHPVSLIEKIFIKQIFNRSSSKKNLDILGKKIAKSLLKEKKKEIIKLRNFSIKSLNIPLKLSNKSETNLSLRLFNLGNIKILSLNGEIFASYRKKILRLLINDPAYRIFTIGYTDYPVGYIPDNEGLKLGGYETDRSIKYFGLSSRFSSCIEDKLISGFKKILRISNK